MKNLEKWKSRRELKGQKQKSVEEKRRCVIKEAAEGGGERERRMGSVTVFIRVREGKAIEDLITTHTNLAKHCFPKEIKTTVRKIHLYLFPAREFLLQETFLQTYDNEMGIEKQELSVFLSCFFLLCDITKSSTSYLLN